MLLPGEYSAMAHSMRATVWGAKKFCTRTSSSPNISRLKVSDLWKNVFNLATRRRQGKVKNFAIVCLHKESWRLRAAEWKCFKIVHLAKISLAVPRQPTAFKWIEAKDKLWMFDNNFEHSRHTRARWLRFTSVDKMIARRECWFFSMPLSRSNPSRQRKIPTIRGEPVLKNSCMCLSRISRQEGASMLGPIHVNGWVRKFVSEKCEHTAFCIWV